MSDDKKPGFFDGLLEGFAESQPERPEDSEALKFAKETIEGLELSDEDRTALIGWLVGEAALSMFAPLLEGFTRDE